MNDNVETIGEYFVPVDPMSEDGDLNCTSCQ